MSRFDIAAAFVRAREGGFVNNPDDHGGATNGGVTQKVYDAYRKIASEPLQSVEFITTPEMVVIYHDLYWTPSHCDLMPPPLDIIHFDTAFNMGGSFAARCLQNALGVPVEDGIIGGKTKAMLAACDPWVVAGRYINRRMLRYITTAQQPGQAQFLRGWFHRVGLLLQSL